MNDDPLTPPIESSVRHMLGDIKEFARREPAKAVAAAFGTGLLINMLPTRALVGTVTAVGVMFMRPVLLSLGVTKVMELCCQKTENINNS